MGRRRLGVEVTPPQVLRLRSGRQVLPQPPAAPIVATSGVRGLGSGEGDRASRRHRPRSFDFAQDDRSPAAARPPPHCRPERSEGPGVGRRRLGVEATPPQVLRLRSGRQVLPQPHGRPHCRHERSEGPGVGRRRQGVEATPPQVLRLRSGRQVLPQPPAAPIVATSGVRGLGGAKATRRRGDTAPGPSASPRTTSAPTAARPPPLSPRTE